VRTSLEQIISKKLVKPLDKPSKRLDFSNIYHKSICLAVVIHIFLQQLECYILKKDILEEQNLNKILHFPLIKQEYVLIVFTKLTTVLSYGQTIIVLVILKLMSTKIPTHQKLEATKMSIKHLTDM
jgi:hypothetical protein